MRVHQERCHGDRRETGRCCVYDQNTNFVPPSSSHTRTGGRILNRLVMATSRSVAFAVVCVALVASTCVIATADIPMGEEGRYVHARRPAVETYSKPSCGPANQITEWGRLVNASVPILPEYPRCVGVRCHMLSCPCCRCLVWCRACGASASTAAHLPFLRVRILGVSLCQTPDDAPSRVLAEPERTLGVPTRFVARCAASIWPNPERLRTRAVSGGIVPERRGHHQQVRCVGVLVCWLGSWLVG